MYHYNTGIGLKSVDTNARKQLHQLKLLTSLMLSKTIFVVEKCFKLSYHNYVPSQQSE